MEQPKTDRERRERELLKKLVREGEVKPGSGEIPEEFWRLPRPADPKGMARHCLIEDRRQYR